MSIASPTLRSSSSTLPWPSCSSWATDRCARPSTAEMFTGTSNTGARSLAVFSSPSPSPGAGVSPSAANSSSFKSVSSAIGRLLAKGSGQVRRQRLGVQALGGERAFQGLGDAQRGAGRIERRRAVAPVQHERGGGKIRIVAQDDLSGIADRLGGLGEGGLQPFLLAGRYRKHELWRRFHFARQRRQRRAQRRVRKPFAGGVGDLPRASQRELRGADAVFVRGRGQQRQRGFGGL